MLPKVRSNLAVFFQHYHWVNELNNHNSSSPFQHQDYAYSTKSPEYYSSSQVCIGRFSLLALAALNLWFPIASHQLIQCDNAVLKNDLQVVPLVSGSQKRALSQRLLGSRATK